jgi:hypothetical protein
VPSSMCNYCTDLVTLHEDDILPFILGLLYILRKMVSFKGTVSSRLNLPESGTVWFIRPRLEHVTLDIRFFSLSV